MLIKKFTLLFIIFLIVISDFAICQVAILHYDIFLKKDKVNIDISKLKEGGIHLSFFVIWANPRKIPHPKYCEYTKEVIEAFREFVQENNTHIQLASNLSDVKEITSQGKIAAILAIEGGHALEGNINVLREYHSSGVRYLTLTWDNTNEIGDAARGNKIHQGLSNFGKEIIKEMESLGMLVDVSHLSEEAFWEVMEIANSPVIASHSNVKALCKHSRNLTDAEIKGIAKSGGVVGINFHSRYLRSDRKKATVNDVIKHIDYIKNLVGVDYVSIGADWGRTIKSPRNLESPHQLKNIREGLSQKGYKEEEIEKILGGNILRVLSALPSK